jgi:CMP-N,N'-diacetyllegionaminic acid synthase
MYKLGRVLGLVVARGDSRRVPRKNLRMLGGKPLVAHTFEAAKAAPSLDRVLVSTDSAEIADLAKRHGVDAPFLRPPELAGDHARVIDAALHALQWLADHEAYVADYVMLLQPTSPFRAAQDIEGALRLAERAPAAEAVVSVTPLDTHPSLAREIDTTGRLWPLPGLGDWCQNLPPVYAVNGAVYLVKTASLLERRAWCPAGALAYVMPPERALDIDTEWHFELAGMILQERLMRHELAA